MVGGFLKGMVWGGIVAGAGLAVLSQIAPPPAMVTAPPAEVQPEPDVAAPAPLPKVPEAEVMPEILQKGPEDTTPQPQPEPPDGVDGPAEMDPDATVGAPATAGADASNDVAPEAAPRTPGDREAPEVAEENPMTQPPLAVEATAPAAPDGAGAQEPPTGLPAALAEARPGPTVPDAPPAPSGEAAPTQTGTPPAAPMEEALLQPVPQPDAPIAPAEVVPQDPGPDGGAAEAAMVGVAPGLQPDGAMDGAVAGVTTDRLPRIGAEEGTDAETAMAAVPEDLLLGTTPLELFAREFDNPDGKPLFAIILIDEGTPAADRASLAALPFAVTFALDPLAPDSAEVARVYREAGQEVAMLAAGIPAGATVADLEQTFQTLDLAMPEAVVVLDRPEGGLQDQSDLARAVVPIVAEQGRGILTYDRGLNPADQVARREGVPSGVIFRVLDSEGESIPKMRNYLDRAAFKAAQEGKVVVIGRTRPETVAAILEWTVEGRGAGVALAPVSAVLEFPPTP